MLKKLYKYDWKSVSMLLLVLHGVLLAYSIIGRLAIAIAENFSSGVGTGIDTRVSLITTIFGMGAVAYILIYAIFIVGIVLATILYLAVRMQKSLFPDDSFPSGPTGPEGFCMRCFPAASTCHLSASSVQ